MCSSCVILLNYFNISAFSSPSHVYNEKHKLSFDVRDDGLFFMAVFFHYFNLPRAYRVTSRLLPRTVNESFIMVV